MYRNLNDLNRNLDVTCGKLELFAVFIGIVTCIILSLYLRIVENTKQTAPILIILACSVGVASLFVHFRSNYKLETVSRE